MPIVVKDFEWTQTAGNVTVKVPLKGVHTSKVSVYADSLYIKAHFAPYFFELDLLHAIDYEKSRVLLGEQGCIVFILHKQDPALEWPELRFNGDEDIRNRRLKAQADYQSRHAEKVNRMLNKTVAKPDGVDWVQKQIDAQREAKESVKQQKAEIFQSAAQDIEQWQSSAKENSVEKNETQKSVSKVIAKEKPIVASSVSKNEVERPPVREFKRITCEFTVCKPDHLAENCLIVDSMPMRTRDKGSATQSS